MTIIRKFIRVLTSLTLFFLIFSVFIVAAYYEYQFEMEVLKRDTTNKVVIATNSFESLINEQLNKAQGLATFYSQDNEIEDEKLKLFSDKLFKSSEDVLYAVMLTDRSTVIYESEKTEINSLMGQDLLTLPRFKEYIIDVLGYQQIVISKPYKSERGINIIDCMLPLYTYENNIQKNVIGFMNISLSFDRLMGKSGVLSLTQEYDIRMSLPGIQEEPSIVFFETTSNSLESAVEIELLFPNTSWLLEVNPESGWKSNFVLIRFIITVGLVLAVLAILYLNGLQNSKAKLRTKIEERTKELRDINDELELSIVSLEETKEQLIRSEKLATLGELVTGVAHEINTPLGNSITLASFMSNVNEDLYDNYKEGNLNNRLVDEYFESVKEISQRLQKNLNRTAEIVNLFKDVAADQSKSELERFKVYDLLTAAILAVKMKYPHQTFQINLICDEQLEIQSSKKALYHITENLLLNSINHGYEKNQVITVEISVKQVKTQISILYHDDGVGIKKEIEQNIFNPFFTTKRNEGYTGLGLHIAYNMTTLVLEGTIELLQTQENGSSFIINFCPRIIH